MISKTHQPKSTSTTPILCSDKLCLNSISKCILSLHLQYPWLKDQILRNWNRQSIEYLFCQGSERQRADLSRGLILLIQINIHRYWMKSWRMRRRSWRNWRSWRKEKRWEIIWITTCRIIQGRRRGTGSQCRYKMRRGLGIRLLRRLGWEVRWRIKNE